MSEGWWRAPGRGASSWVIALFAACATETEQSQPPRVAAPIAATPGIELPPDVGLDEVMERVHFAFRSRAEGFHGGHTTYASAIDRAGRVTLSMGYGHRPAGELAELTLETIAMGRGASSEARVADEPDDHGHVHIERGDAIERLENTADGLSQSWSFANRPAGRGPFIARVRVSGLPYAGSTANGLHFLDPEDELGFVYGTPTWIDADGRRTQLALRYGSGAIEIVVPRAVIDASRFPAILDPVVGPEIGMDEAVTVAPVATRVSQSVATNGSTALVAWTDFRGDSFDIYATRVDSAGTVLDRRGGIPIRVGFEEQRAPAIAWDGTNFIVVWQDRRVSGSETIFGARVTPAGVVLDPEGLQIMPATPQKLTPAIASSGTDVLLVWRQRVTGARYDIRATTLSPTLVPGDPAGTVIEGSTEPSLNPAVTWDGTQYLVVWEQTGGIFASRVSRTATPIDAAPFSVAPAGAIDPDVSSTGTNSLVVWADATRVRGARVSPAGAVLDPAGFNISPAPNAQERPKLCYDGVNYLVGWRTTTTATPDSVMTAARVTSAGTVLDPAGVTLTGDPFRAADARIACTPTFRLLTWGTSSPSFVFEGLRLAGDLSPLDAAPLRLSTEGNRQERPAVSFSGSQFLVVWQDRRPGGADVFGARLSSTGEVLDPLGIPIGATAVSEAYADVTWNGASWLVVFARGFGPGDWIGTGAGGQIHASRVSPSGALLDGDGILIHDSFFAHTARVAWNGSHHLVVWTDRLSSPEIRAQRLAADGSLVGTWFRTHTLSSTQLEPDVASDGTDFFVVWSHDLGFEIRATRVSAGGMVLDPTSILLGRRGVLLENPRVEFGGGSYLTVWGEYAAGVLGRRVRSDGSVLEAAPVVIYTSGRATTFAALGFNGTNFLVAWDEWGSDLVHSEVLAMRVSPALITLDPAFSISTTPLREGMPAIAGAGPGRWLAAYHRFVPEEPFGTIRVRARFVTETGCASDADCPVGVCVDGVCCNSACGGGRADCQACSVAFGGVVDGTCGPLRAPVAPSTVCRDAASECDVAETCSAASTMCPSDEWAPSGTTCRASAGDCDVAETCSGAGPACPPDAFGTGSCRAASGLCDLEENCDGLSADCPEDRFAASTPCRPSAGDCDVEEACDGTSSDCPLDAHASAGIACRASTGACDLEEACSGDSPLCPADGFVPNGTACEDGATCNGAETCTDGECAPGETLACDDGDACSDDLCEEPSGCRSVARAECCRTTSECDDADPCTADSCPVPGAPCVHSAIASCCRHVGECDDGDPCTDDACPTPGGACTNTAREMCCRDASECDDRDPCTTDACSEPGGSCSSTPMANCCIGPLCDAGPALGDAGADAGALPNDDEGCGCAAADSVDGSWLIALVALALAQRRRRRFEPRSNGGTMRAS